MGSRFSIPKQSETPLLYTQKTYLTTAKPSSRWGPGQRRFWATPTPETQLDPKASFRDLKGRGVSNQCKVSAILPHSRVFGEMRDLSYTILPLNCHSTAIRQSTTILFSADVRRSNKPANRRCPYHLAWHTPCGPQPHTCSPQGIKAKQVHGCKM